MKRAILTIIILSLFFSSSMFTANALTENEKEGVFTPKPYYNVVLGPYIFFWMDLDLSTKEFGYLYYNRGDDSLHFYIEFLAEDVNERSIIKWGWLLRPRSNPNVFDHKNPIVYDYYWISFKEPTRTSVDFVNNRILLDTSSSVGKILWTRGTEPCHNPTIPRRPGIIGPFQGKPGIEHEYHFYSRSYTDSNLNYFIDWGDGTNSGWIGPYESCEGVKLTHKWNSEKTYTIKVKAKDSMEKESVFGYHEVFISNNPGYYSQEYSEKQTGFLPFQNNYNTITESYTFN